MTNRDRAILIERVLRGVHDALMHEEFSDEVNAGIRCIRERYSSLKREHHDFTTSAHLAKVEWIEAYLNATENQLDDVKKYDEAFDVVGFQR